MVLEYVKWSGAESIWIIKLHKLLQLFWFFQIILKKETIRSGDDSG